MDSINYVLWSIINRLNIGFDNGFIKIVWLNMQCVKFSLF